MHPPPCPAGESDNGHEAVGFNGCRAQQASAPPCRVTPLAIHRRCLCRLCVPRQRVWARRGADDPWRQLPRHRRHHGGAQGAGAAWRAHHQHLQRCAAAGAAGRAWAAAWVASGSWGRQGKGPTSCSGRRLPAHSWAHSQKCCSPAARDLGPRAAGQLNACRSPCISAAQPCLACRVLPLPLPCLQWLTSCPSFGRRSCGPALSRPLPSRCAIRGCCPAASNKSRRRHVHRWTKHVQAGQPRQPT